MNGQWTNGRAGENATSRRTIDMALGMLMGLRGCTEREAFDDLVAAVHHIGVGPAALGAALSAVVSGTDDDVPHRNAVQERWGHLVPTRAVTA